jgi:hypothetical protein
VSVAAIGAGSLTGAVRLGSAVVDLEPGAVGTRVALVDGEVDAVAVPDFATSLARRTTDAAGRVSVFDLQDDRYAVTLGRGIEDIGQAISAQDALAALKLAVGRNPNPDPASIVSPYQLIAADVTGDGKVTAEDALGILKMAVRRSDAPSRDWIFLREDADLWDEALGRSALTRSAVAYEKFSFDRDISGPQAMNVVGVLKGDVNGSWTPSTTGYATLDPSHLAELAQRMAVPLDLWG